MHICLEKRERENGASSATEEKSGKADHDPFVIRTVSVHACLQESERERDLVRLRGGGGERGDHGNNGGSDIRRGGRRRSAAPIGAAVSQSVRR